jgi:hypothetical protein
MSTLLIAGASLAAAGVALAVCGRLLLRPLAAILLELCGERHRAEFWTRMVTTCGVVGMLAASLMAVLVAPPQPAFAAAAVARWTLLGVATGLLVVIAVVAWFTRRVTPPPSYGAGRPHSAR